MVNYSNGKIYKIVNDINDMIYIGSTTQTLTKRFNTHKQQMKQEKCVNYRIYTCMKDIGVENFHIVLIKNVECQNKEQLFMNERIEIEKYDKKCLLNTKLPIRFNTETLDIQRQHSIQYRINNRQKYLDTQKRWYRNNRATKLEKKRMYNMINKEKLNTYSKQYNESHKEAIRNYDKVRYERTKYLKILPFFACKFSIDV